MPRDARTYMRKPPQYAGNWTERAACHGLPVDLFFPSYGRMKAYTTAKPPPEIQRICDLCPVAGDCLTWALRNHEIGIWGGTTEGQRVQILKSRLRVTCIRCGSRDIISAPRPDTRLAICFACGLSWKQPPSVDAR